MAILQITTDFAGQVGILPRLVRLLCDDDYATVTASGYLNSAASLGITILPTDFIFASYSGGFGMFNPTISGSNITLSPTSDHSVSGPTTVGHLAVYTDTNGDLGEDAATAINAGNIQAGLSGTAGYLASYPATPATGSLRLVGASNAGDTVTQITNEPFAQNSVLTIPDPGATGNFVMRPSALVNGNLVKASGTAGLVADAGARIISNTTGTYAGGGTSNAFTATGLTASCVGSAVIRTSTNAVSIAKAVPGTNTLTVTFSADPGAGTTVDYIYTTASQS